MIKDKKRETKNNYIILSRDCHLYPNLISKEVKIYKTPQKNLRKNQKNNNLINSNEINIENAFNKINDSFNDKKGDRESLILQISKINSINEINCLKNRTPEKDLKSINKSAKNQKLYKKKMNCYNNNYNRNKYNNLNATATKKEKEHNKFTFHNKTERKSNIKI